MCRGRERRRRSRSRSRSGPARSQYLVVAVVVGGVQQVLHLRNLVLCVRDAPGKVVQYVIAGADRFTDGLAVWQEGGVEAAELQCVELGTQQLCFQHGDA